MGSEQSGLWVILKKEHFTPEVLKREIEFLARILYSGQSTPDFYAATEVIDINRYRIIQKPNLIQQAVNEGGNKPFVFICNKN